jgi:hydroxyethylthiazole kinase-like uncharacterized protein yjeF
MKIVTAEQMRELDRRTIQEHGIPGETLMDRAGRGVARAVRELAGWANGSNPRVVFFAGTGNNGGDAFVAARYLQTELFHVEVFLIGSSGRLKGDARSSFLALQRDGVAWREVADDATLDAVAGERFEPHVVVDGLLGTGTRGPAQGLVARAIEWINRLGARALVIAIDMPSGLDADGGAASGPVVRADLTVTMGLPKHGLLPPAAGESVGAIEVVDIGIPPEVVDAVAPAEPIEFIGRADVQKLIPRRRHVSHKGDYGHVLLIGGARGYSGAMALAARGALRSGAGLVTVMVPAGLAGHVATLAPEAMVHGAPETDTGSLAADGWAEWAPRLNSFDAVLIGPGLTCHRDSGALVERVLAEARAPLVLDADAISLLAGRPEMLRQAAGPVIITPHPGELARLCGVPTAQIQENRRQWAREAAARTSATVVLKGAGTLVAAPSRPVAINGTGNPGMASGGMGDVLAGLLTGLAGQGLAPFDAARAAVYLHGRAGDVAAWQTAQATLVAGDVIDRLPAVFRETWAR